MRSGTRRSESEAIDAARLIHEAYRRLGSPDWFSAWLRRIAADIERDQRGRDH